MVNQSRSTPQPYIINEKTDALPIDIKVYPNPVTNHLQIQTLTKIPQTAEISIQNNLGMVLQQKREWIPADFYQTSLSVFDFPTSMYWVKVRFMETGVWQVVPIIKA